MSSRDSSWTGRAKGLVLPTIDTASLPARLGGRGGQCRDHLLDGDPGARSDGSEHLGIADDSAQDADEAGGPNLSSIGECVAWTIVLAQ
jgi:hypothetical protein